MIRKLEVFVVALAAMIGFGFTASAQEPKGIITVTVDDGPASLFFLGFPKMKALNIPVTAFIETGCVGKDPWCLTKRQLYALHSAGNEIASHFTEHTALTEFTPDRIEQGLKASADAIEEMVGERPVSFAPPYGEFNDAILDLIAEAGYKYNVLGWGGSDGFNPLDGIDYFQIGRFDTNKMTAKETCTAVEKASEGFWVVLLFHDIVMDDAPDEWQVSKAM